MALRDADIERYSRQIILPEIGGRGQERLLAAAVTLVGAGDLAGVAARYLAGAGIGTLLLDPAGAAAFAADLRQLNPEVVVGADAAPARSAVIVAADLPNAVLEATAREARTRTVPLIAAALGHGGGWLFAPAAVSDCAACAADAVAHRAPSPPTAVDVAAAGVLGSLLALAVIERVLGLASSAPTLRWFTCATSLLTPLSYARRGDCPVCQ